MYWHVFLGGWSDGCLPYRQYVVSRWMRVVPLVTSYPSSIRTLPDFSIIVFWFRSVALSPRPSLRCGMCPSGVHQSVSKSDTQNPPLIWWNLMETLGDSMFKGRLEYLYLQGLCSIQWGCCGDKVASNHTATKHHHSYPFLPWVLLKTGDLSKNMRNMVLFRQNPPWFGSSPGPKNCNPSLQEAGSVTGSFANLRGLVTSQRQGSEARWHRKTTGIQEIAKLLQLVQMTWSIFGGPSKIYWL